MPGERWTDKQHRQLLAAIGAHTRQINKKLRRSRFLDSDSLTKRAKQLTGRTISQLVEAKGLTLTDIARKFGVSRYTVQRWTERTDNDRLPSQDFFVGDQRRHIVKQTDLIIFIRRGVLVKWGHFVREDWPPKNHWRTLIEEAERTWRAEWLSTQDICKLLCVSEKVPPRFPAPEIRSIGRQMPNWWRRSTVRDWVRERPRYHSTLTKKELGI